MSTLIHENSDKNAVVQPGSGVGYAKPSLEVLSCTSCDTECECLAKQLTLSHDHDHHLVKNRRVFDKNKHLFRSGDNNNAIYIVSSGSVKTYVNTENGDEQILNFFMVGDVIGLESMGSGVHVSSAVTLEKTRLCKLPLDDLKNRPLNKIFLEQVSANLLRVHNTMLVLATKDADSRLASFLIDMSGRCTKNLANVDVFCLPMTRYDIANYLGLAIETVSRTLRRFQDSDILEVSHREIIIHDYKCLMAIAGTQITR